jgi:DNA-binding transcriptional ArsR family regulator
MSGIPANGDGKRHKSVWGPLIRFVLSLALPQTPKLVLLDLISRAVPAVPEKHPARCRVSAKRAELAKAAGVTESTVSHVMKDLEKAGLVRRGWGRHERGNFFRVYELVGAVGDALKFGVTEPPRKTFDRATANTSIEKGAEGQCAPSSKVGVSPAAGAPCPQEQGGGAPSGNPEVPLKAPPEERDEVPQDERARALGAPRAPTDGNGHDNDYGSPPAFSTPRLKSPPREMTAQEVEERKRVLRQQFQALSTQETAQTPGQVGMKRAETSKRNGQRRKVEL